MGSDSVMADAPEVATGARDPNPAGESAVGIPAVLRIEQVGDDRFRGESTILELPRVFGGQLLAQGLVAAARTVPSGRPAHSLHAYFLSAGDLRHPIDYYVERTRDGGRMSCRTVTMTQGDRLIAEMMCSFVSAAGGVGHQRRPRPGPGPSELPELVQALDQWGGLGASWGGFESLEVRARPEEVEPSSVDDPGELIQQVWQRVPDPMADEEVLHQAMLVYASDIAQLAAVLVPHGIPLGVDVMPGRAWDGVSVDHAVWFHRPVRADEWMCFEQCSPSADAGRGFTRADVFTAGGVLVASVAQEGVIRDLGSARPAER